MLSLENKINQKQNKMDQQLLSLIQLAKINNDESWEKIDSQLPMICNNSDVIDWARKNTKNPSNSLCDLAGTIFEASSIEFTNNDIKLLEKLMENEGYPGFRAACALTKRLNLPIVFSIKNKIKEKLESFIEDPDVMEIANEYLKKFD